MQVRAILQVLNGFVNEGYKEAQLEFSKQAPSQEVNNKINQFRDLVNRNQVQGAERNIDAWRKQGWQHFNNFVTSKQGQHSKTQLKRSKVTGNQVIVRDDKQWLIVVPLDKTASCYHGTGTEWCTASTSVNYFHNYFHKNEQNLIYVINKQTKGKWAIAVSAGVFDIFNSRDNIIDDSQFREETGFDARELVSQALSMDTRSKISRTREEHNDKVKKLEQKAKNRQYDQEFEQLLLEINDSGKIVKYCREHKGKWPEGERAILGGELSYIKQYAMWVIRGRWPEGERELLRRIDHDPGEALHYASSVIRQRDEKFEQAFLKVVRNHIDTLLSYDVARRAEEYAETCIGGSWGSIGRNDIDYYIHHKGEDM